MSETFTFGAWQKDPDAYDPQARIRQFTLDGRQFTAHSLRAEGADQYAMTVREAESGRYVATVSNWTELPVQLSAALVPAPQSGYTPCACRDCMDTTVSSDMNKPELCSDCKDAGCEPFAPDSTDYNALPGHMRECRRDDAYGTECGNGDGPCPNACQCGCESGTYECQCAEV